MTQEAAGQSPPQHDTETASPVTAAATGEAKGVASTAADRGGQLAQTAAEEVKQLADGATREARDLVQEGRAQLLTQARDGQQKAARSLRALADQLGQMSDRTEEPGVASDVTRQISERTRSVAQWLEHREPGELLEDIRRFARRRPSVFLADAAIAGVLVGRVTRGAVAHQKVRQQPLIPATFDKGHLSPRRRPAYRTKAAAAARTCGHPSDGHRPPTTTPVVAGPARRACGSVTVGSLIHNPPHGRHGGARDG